MKEPSSRLIRGVDTQKYMTQGARSSQRVGLPPRCMCVSDAPWLADDGLIEDINAGVTEGKEREPHSWLVKSIPEDHNLLWVAFECYSWQWRTRRPLAWTTSSPDLPQPSAQSLHSLSSRGRSTAAVETMVQHSLEPTTPGTCPHLPCRVRKCWMWWGWMRWSKVKVVEGVGIRHPQTTEAAGIWTDPEKLEKMH